MTQNFVSSNSLLRQEYEQVAQLFSAQPALTQRFVETQARQLAEAIVQHTPQVHLTLPAQLVAMEDGRQPLTVPAGYREQVIGGSKVLDRLARVDGHQLLRQRLAELEHDPEPGVSISAVLLRYAIVIDMAHHMLPAGRLGEVRSRRRRGDSDASSSCRTGFGVDGCHRCHRHRRRRS